MPDPNPYESPKSSPSQVPRRGRHKAALVGLLLLSLPAGAVAFYTTCTIVSSVVDGRGEHGWYEELVLGVQAGAVVGLLVMSLVIFLAIRWYRKKSAVAPPADNDKAI